MPCGALKSEKFAREGSRQTTREMDRGGGTEGGGRHRGRREAQGEGWSRPMAVAAAGKAACAAQTGRVSSGCSGHSAGRRQSGICSRCCGPGLCSPGRAVGEPLRATGVEGEPKVRDLLCNLSGNP